MREKKDTIKTCTALKKVAIALTAIAVLLGIAAFVTPPRWIIDKSVIAFVGEIVGLIALFFAWEAVDLGIDTKVTHGNTSVEVGSLDK